MSGLCPYKNIFGAPGTGVHSYRFMGIAVVDMGMTLLFAWFLSYWYNVPLVYTVAGMLVLGIVAHRIFCVNSTINVALLGRV